DVSPRPAPRSTRRPRPIAPTASPSACTEALETRWTTARTHGILSGYALACAHGDPDGGRRSDAGGRPPARRRPRALPPRERVRGPPRWRGQRSAARSARGQIG